MLLSSGVLRTRKTAGEDKHQTPTTNHHPTPTTIPCFSRILIDMGSCWFSRLR
jgi:hypothetical protein